MDKKENNYPSRHLSQTTAEYDRMGLSEVHVLAAERNATMEDHILQSKKELYDAIIQKIEEYDKGIRKDPEGFYKQIAEELQSVERKDIIEHTAKAKGRLVLTQKKIAAAKDADLKRVYKEYATLDAFECNLYQKKDFFLLSYWILYQWTVSDRITLENAEMDTMRLNKMIFDRAAEWFEPPAGWTYKDAEAALEPLRKQGEAFDEMIARGDPYTLILNSPVTNDVKEIGGPRTKKIEQVEALDKQKKADIIGQVETTSHANFTLEHFTKLGGLDTKTCKLMDMCILDVTKRINQNRENLIHDPTIKDKTVIIPLKEYMSLTGLKDTKTAREQLTDAADRLVSVSVEYKQTKGKNTVTFFSKDNLFQHATYSRGKVEVLLSDRMWLYLRDHSNPMPFNKNIFRINGNNNPNAYYFANKLFNHHNMNLTKPNANRISVSTLLKGAPSIPSHDEVLAGNGNTTARIIERFERDLDALMRPEYGILESWEYCNAKGEPLTDEQVDLKNYDVFSQLLINFKLKDYPDQTERIKKMQAAKKSHRPRAKAR